jgi:hypothetical protein
VSSSPVTATGPGLRGTVRRLDAHVWWLVVCGLIVVQLAWIAALPPFGGTDEFDHAHRAAAVADGQWVAPPSAATDNSGAMVVVPADMVEAAGPQCRALPYTDSADCTPTDLLADGRVTVASGAGRYHPAYYAVVGTVGLPFDGSAALYAMRLATVALFGLFLLAAAWSTRSTSRTGWPLLAVVVACLPTMLFSGSIVAPNGIELAAALALWCSLLAVASTGPTRRGRRTSAGLWAIAAASGVTVLTLRSLGPLWFVLIALTVLLVAEHPRALAAELLGSRPGRAATLVSVLAGAASVVWVLSQRSLALRQEDIGAVSWGDKLLSTLLALPLWVLQSVGAFPFRNGDAPPVVYVCAALAWGLLVVWGWRRTGRRMRGAMLLVVLGSAVVPAAATLLTFDSFGVAWQGRYGYPYAMGLVLLAGCALDREGARLRCPGWVTATVGTGVLLAVHVPGPVAVLLLELDISPLAGTSAWSTAPPWVVAVVAAAGVALVGLALRPLIERRPPAARRTASAEPVPQTTAPLSGP